VLLHPRERTTLAFVADNPGKWMLASSILEHQSTGLATWFEVV
jgi:FtsP/CotA-like multicopper oxidase with cupredoxin domain